MNNIGLILALAVLVEALVQYGKEVFQKTINWTQVAALIVGVALALAAQVDLFAALGIAFVVPHVGVVLTGILFSRGANYTADIIKRVQGALSGVNSEGNE